MRSRAWLYVLTIAALIVPAVGIAYLGAVSYRDERGAVSAQNAHQREAALDVASRIARAIDDALGETDRSATRGAPPASPIARFWFWIDPDGHLRVPAAAPAAGLAATGLERGASCAGGRLEDCVRELATQQSRVARLHAAERAEATASLAEARRQYTSLAAFADTGPAALLGLARVLGRLDDPHARDVLGELERRFGDRSFEGVPVRLVVAILRAGARPDAVAAIANDVLAGAHPAGAGSPDGSLAYAMPPVIQLGVLEALRGKLAADPARVARLDAQIADVRQAARMAAGLAEDVGELARSATAAWHGR
ncbi:MAG TPA: hypothetical protein VFP84_20235, partial [Kofleriaceae bacterium]|nr:hypothetical protein [Kofleriaceae bacterium]